MRILTFLMLAIVVGAGQMWAETDEPSNIKRGTITGGFIEFYADEACTSDFEGDVAANATVYVKATPEIGNTAIGVIFTAKKGISTDAMQAPRRSAEGPGIADDITVSAVTGKPGIYSFTMPNAENTNVTVNATFATPAQQLVSYVDESYETKEVNAYVLDETMHVLPAGFYVVPVEGLSLDHGISSNSSSGSVAIIIPDGLTLSVNGSFGMGCSLSFFGQTNATGKLTINTTTDGTNLGGRLTVAHVDITSDGGSLGGSNGCIFAGHQTKGNTVTVRSDGNSIRGGNKDVTIKYCNVDLVSESGSCIASCPSGLTVTGLADGSNMLKLCSKSGAIHSANNITIKYCDVDIINESNIAVTCPNGVTIEGVATGDKVNTVIVRSAGDCIGTSNNPVTISYCNVEMTGTTQTDNVYDACGSSGITTSGGVVITGRTDVTNTLKVRCGGNTTSSCYGISGGNNPVIISHYNVDIVNEKGYGISTAYDVTITGGQVEITGGTNGKGIHSAIGNITYTWVSTTDYIKASSYYLNSSKAVVFADGQRFVAYNMANANDISATAIVSGTVNDVTVLAGKTLRPLDGNYVSVNAADFTFSGSTSTTSPFTITTGEGENETTTHYYICKKDDPVTLSYAGSDFVMLSGLPEGTTLAAVEGQPMQRSFTMPAGDVVLTTTSVTGLTATLATYDGTALTPEIKQGDDVFDAANYAIAYQLGDDAVTEAKNVNTYTCTLTGLGQYFGTTTVSFTIVKADYDVTDITKYVPQYKPGNYTFALPALPDGAAYSFTKTDEGGIIASHAYDTEHNTLTVATNSGTTSGTAATIAVAATGATNYNDYNFKVNVIVSEYTTAYGWPEQTNIYLIGNDWAFYKRDQVERAYHDNELVWSADGITLNTSLITIQNGETVSDIGYTAKVGETVLTAGENTLVLAPGAYRLEITGDDGKLDDWVDFKVIKLVEDENFVFNVSNARTTAPEEAQEKGLRVDKGGSIGECTANAQVTYNEEDVTNSENMTLWYRGTGFGYDDDELYQNTTYRTPARGMTGFHTTFTVGNGGNSTLRVYNVINGSASLDGVSQINTVCGKLVWHGEGEEIKQKLDLDDLPVSSGIDGGYVYYVGTDCPDFYLKEDGKVYYKDKTGEHLEAENKTYTDGKDIFYAGGETIFEYTDLISYGFYSFTLDDDAPAPLCENRKALGDIIGYCHCPKDANGNCTECFSQNGNTITICGETIEMGPYIVVGTNFILTGNRAIYNMVPDESITVKPASFSTTIDGSTITFCGYSIDAGDRPIIKGDISLDATYIGRNLYVPCAYARYETAPYCYAIARRDIDLEVRRSVVSVDCKSEYKSGEDVDIEISSCSYRYPDDTKTYHGSTGDISVFLNNVYYTTLRASNSHDLSFDDLPAGTYKLEVVLAGDQGFRGASTTITFKVVRTNSKVTLTGKQNTAGEAFASGANIEYDPENPIVINAVNDQAVSDTYWKWQLSNTSDAGVVELGETVNNSESNGVNSEDISLNTVGLGTVTLKARFSGNELYAPATGAITFTVVPKNVTSPIIELVDQSTIYYDGTAKEPAVKVYYAEGKEIPADQYDVTYDNNTNVSSTNSKAKIIVKSKTGALYTIDAEKEFEIQETIVLFAANSTNLWATFCSQNEYEVPEGCTAYTIGSISGSTVMLSDALTTVPAYTPVLIQRDANVTLPVTAIYKAAGSAPASGYDAQTGLAATPGTAFTFYGNCLRSDVSADDFKDYYNEGQTYLLFDGKFILADENGGLGAHKCLLVLNGTNNAPVLSIGETTNLVSIDNGQLTIDNDVWYTLDGRKLNGKPTKKGLYIHNGRKVVIK